MAHRLALAGRAIAHGESDLYWTGPRIASASAGAGAVKLAFDPKSVGAGGLELRAPRNASSWVSEDVWEVCTASACTPGSQQGWASVNASLAGKATVELALPAGVADASAVSAVRFAWECFPCTYLACPLYDADSGLPAAPFIVDVAHAARR